MCFVENQSSLTFLIAVALSYYIYADAQKRGVNKEYPWVLFNTFIPFIGFLIYLWKRPKILVEAQDTLTTESVEPTLQAAEAVTPPVAKDTVQTTSVKAGDKGILY